MLIDCSYFAKGPRHILNATMGTADEMPNPNAAEVNAAILAYIDEYQEQFLSEMLGHSIGNKVYNYLVCQEEDEKPPHVKSMEAVCERLREPFADYVFFHILRDINTQTTITGLVMLKCANAYVSPLSRQVNVWNAMVDKNRIFEGWCQSEDCQLKGITVSKNMTTKINILNI